MTGMYIKECRFFLVMLCQKIATLFPLLFQLIFITESLSYKKLLKNPQQMKKIGLIAFIVKNAQNVAKEGVLEKIKSLY